MFWLNVLTLICLGKDFLFGGEKMSAFVEEKKKIVEEIKDRFDRAVSAVFIDYRGLTVAEVTELRNKYREAGIEYKVLKNTLIGRAIDGKGLDGVNEFLEGPTAVAFSYDDEIAPAKITYDFIKQVNKMEIKCGVFNNEFTPKDEVIVLASLPSRDELLAKAVGSIKSPIMNLVYTLNAIKEQKEKEEA